MGLFIFKDDILITEYDIEALGLFSLIIGCDEVGRGPIAGPVVGCAVSLSSKQLVHSLQKLNITDSKKLSSKKRRLILELLGIDLASIKIGQVYHISYEQESFSFCIEENSHKIIDEINILQASLDAMARASEKLKTAESKIFVDGNKIFKTPSPAQAIIKGDSKYTVIALASIIAKEFRDEKMRLMDAQFPGYNLSKHAGYPTKEHRDAVREKGPSPIHRKSFKGVKEYI